MKTHSKCALLVMALLSNPSQSAETDAAMRSVSYSLAPTSVSISSYQTGKPASMKIQTCATCDPQVVDLATGVQLMSDTKTLNGKSFIESFHKKDFEMIRLGINREKQQITYINLASDHGEEPESERLEISGE